MRLDYHCKFSRIIFVVRNAWKIDDFENNMTLESLTLRPFSRPLANQAVQLPGSKSISNRALLLASLCDGEVVLDGLLKSEDTQLMLECLHSLGVKTEGKGHKLKVYGVGKQFPVKQASLYVGTAGTVARLLIGVLGTQKEGSFHIDGSEVMRKRPMKGLTDLLQQIGCKIEFLGEEGALPFVLKPAGFQETKLQVDASASSQVLSAVLLASAMADRKVVIRLSSDSIRKPYVIMTCRMMKSFGGPDVSWNESFSEFHVSNPSGYDYEKSNYTIESDASAASYFLALPRVVGGSLDVFNFDVNGLQGDVGFAEVLKGIGGEMEIVGRGLRVSFSHQRVHSVNHDFFPISDTFMTLAAISPLLSNSIRIEGIAHTRKQESDRVSAMATELRKLGQGVEEEEDALQIFPNLNALVEVAREGVEIETYKDHRIAMSFGVLGCKDLLGNETPWMTINDPGCCEKTFPDFFEVLEALRGE